MIRDAVASDAKGIAEVHVRSWQSAYVGLMPAEYLASLTASLPNRQVGWAKAIDRRESETLVYEANGAIIGWVSVGPCRDDDLQELEAGEVMAIYTLKEYWGTNVGVDLWRSGLKRLLEQGFRSFSLWVLSGNERAVRFYLRHGGHLDTNSQRALSRGGVTLEEVRYIWKSFSL